jgi:hypothetical protein
VLPECLCTSRCLPLPARGDAPEGQRRLVSPFVKRPPNRIGLPATLNPANILTSGIRFRKRHMLSTSQQRDQDSTKDAAYASEARLVSELSFHISSGNGPIFCKALGAEFNYASGRTDLIGVCSDGKLHAFEAKLYKWRKAFDQARRNSCFAHYTYVVLPRQSAQTALTFTEKFRRLGVGLVILGRGQLTLAIKPKAQRPFVPWLTDAAKNMLKANERPM